MNPLTFLLSSSFQIDIRFRHNIRRRNEAHRNATDVTLKLDGSVDRLSTSPADCSCYRFLTAKVNATGLDDNCEASRISGLSGCAILCEKEKFSFILPKYFHLHL